MDQRQRNAAILAAIAAYTEKHASSESAAREALEREGFLMPTADAIKQMRDDGHNEQADILAEFLGSPDRRIGYLEGLLSGWLDYTKSPDDAHLSHMIAVTEKALNNA